MKHSNALMVLAFSTAAMIAMALPARAVDLGASISGSYGWSWAGGMGTGKKHDGFGSPFHQHRKMMDGYLLGINFSADTVLDKKDLMNLRISLGYRNGVPTGGGRHAPDLFSRHSLHSILWTNTLGFGIVRRENLRFWVGPQLGMSVDLAKKGPGPFGPRRGDGVNTAMYGYLGAAAGLNYTPVKDFTLTAELGVRLGHGGSLDNLRLKASRVEPYLNLGFLYRVGAAK